MIMPSLNVEAYIEKSLKSVMEQTLRDIDIICVDAGSTDGTLETIERLAGSDSRIKVICSERKSYGYQVNKGIEAAEGEYIGIVETDDYIEKDMYEKLYESTAEAGFPDIIKCSYKAYWTDREGRTVFKERKLLKPYDFYREVVNPMDQIFLPIADWYLWNGIYKKTFIDKNGIKLSESPGAAFQDIGFLHRTNAAAASAFYTDDCLYNYCIDRAGSSSNSGKELGYSHYEFHALLQENWEEKAARAIYIRMAKSFVCCCRTFDEEKIGNSEFRSRYEWFVNMLKAAIDHGRLGEQNLSAGIWKRLQVLLNNLDEVYEQYQRDHKFVNDQNEKWRYVIFGCGERGQAVFEKLYEKRRKIIAFMDNDAKLWGTSLEGIPVLKPQVYAGEDVKYIIGNEACFEDIQEQLLGLGVRMEDIGVCW